VLHEQDLKEGFGRVYLPFALARKYPNAEREWDWQYVFPAKKRSIDPRSGIERRHHVDASVLQRAINQVIVTPYAIALLPISLRMAMTSELFKNSLATKTT